MNNLSIPVNMQNIDIDESKLGFVYLLHRNNGSHIVKVGYTSKNAESRAGNYTDGEWHVSKEYSMPVWLAKLTEKAAHAKLLNFWLDPKLTGGTASEIFTCSIEHADTAIKLAYIEQLELALKLIGLPKILVQAILSINGLSNESSGKEILEKINSTIRDDNHEKNTLQLKMAELESSFEKIKKDVKNDELVNASLIRSLREKISTLETDVNTYKTIINNSSKDYTEEIAYLESIAEKKINLKDFDRLRESFRRSVETIKGLRLAQYSNGN
jgi:ribosomal protein S13